MNERIRKRLPTLAKIALLVGAVVVVYWPARHGGFILDDDYLLTENPLIKSPAGWHRFWSTEATDFWPVTNDALWVQWRLWGLDPTGYHVVNILLQMANALLIWKILSQLRIPGAYWAALLFAVHPVNVESVAWIAQIKNGLSLWFFLLSILWHLKGAGGWNRWYALSLAAFALAGLSKGSVLILPLVLLLIAWWQKGRIGRGELTKLAPYFAVAATLAVTDIWFQTHGSGVALRTVTMAQRLAGAGAVVWFYLGKAVAPIQLSFVYPQWEIRTDELRWWLPLAAASLVTALLWWQRNSPRIKWVRPTLFVWLFFCVALLPVMGLTDVGFMKFSLVADHYQQIALIAVVALAAAGGSMITRRCSQRIPWAPWIGALFVVAVTGLLMVKARQQSEVYESPIRLYEATLAENPECALLHNNLGLALASADRVDKAMAHYRKALELNSGDAATHTNFGVSLANMGRKDEAVEQYQAALQCDSDYVPAMVDWAIILSERKQTDQALAKYRQALKINPNCVQALNDLGALLAKIGKTDEAIEQYQHALELDPACSESHFDWGTTLAEAGQSVAAKEHYRQALALKPDYASAHTKLGDLLAAEGETSAALEHYQEAMRLKPDDADAHYNVALLFAAQQQWPAAIEHFKEAARLEPDNLDTQQHLGIALAMADRLPEAQATFEQMIQAHPDSVEGYFNLAMALARSNRRAEALTAANKALQLARAQQLHEMETQIQQWIKSYSADPSGAVNPSSADQAPAGH